MRGRNHVRNGICVLTIVLLLPALISSPSLWIRITVLVALLSQFVLLAFQIWHSVSEKIKDTGDNSQDQENSVFIERDMMASLLRGGMNPDRRNLQTFMSSTLKFQTPYFVLLRVNSKDYKNAVPSADTQQMSRYYSMFTDLLEYVIPAYLPFSSICRLTCFEGDYYLIINLIDVSEEVMITDGFIAYIEDCLEEAHNYLDQVYNFYIQIDVSSVYNGIKYLNKAYNEVCSLAEYSRLMDITSPCISSHEAEFCQDKIDVVELEINQTVKYRNALSRNSYQQAGIILKGMVDSYTHGSLENICSFRGYLEDHLNLAYYCLEECDSEFRANAHHELLQAREIERLDTLEELNKRTLESFDFLNSWYHNKLAMDGTKIQDILAYINQNYQDYNLSTNMICDAFGISSSYLFRLFRNNSRTLLETIHQVRLDHAKQLLLNTEMTVDEISHQVGFSGRWSLIRSFKNYEDCTPTQYRESHMNQ